MNSQYQVPLGLCQWCYKVNGRFIIDCLCLVCEQCLNQKKNWVDENGKCFNCDKNTARRNIDLKHNQQQASLYFGNINFTMQNFQKLQEFQNQVARKYCHHLEKKVTQLETIIRSFVAQFPQYKQFFVSAFKKMRKNDNQASHRSKSAQMEIPQNYKQNKQIQQNHTERNLPNLPIKVESNHRMNENINQKYLMGQKTMNLPPQLQNKNKNYNEGSKASSNASMESNFSSMFPNPNHYGNKLNNQAKKFVHQNQPNFDSIPKNKVRKDQQKMIINPSKVQMQGPPQIQQNQIYVLGGSKKVSNQRKAHQPIKLNNAVNIQTAIRSIRSDEERVFESNGKTRQMYPHQNQPAHYKYGHQENSGDSQEEQDKFFSKFGRKSK